MRALGSVGLTLASVGLFALSALPARAADTAVVGTSEIAGGYSYVYESNPVSGVSGRGNPAGWFFSAGANISDAFAVVGDISGNYRSDSQTTAGATLTVSANIYTFLAGPHVTARSGQLNFYGQFLVGAAREAGSFTGTLGGVSVGSSGSDTEFCLAPGAGVEINLGEHSALRSGVSERFIRNPTTTTSTQPTFAKEFQLQVGLVYRFGN
jgi:Outer membrane protein beta-barrel domain